MSQNIDLGYGFCFMSKNEKLFVNFCNLIFLDFIT